MTLTILPCIYCGTPTVSNWAYARYPRLRDTYARRGAGQKCVNCYYRERRTGKKKPDTWPRPCVDCGHSIIPEGRFKKDPALRVHRRHAGYGKCQPCLTRAKGSP
jgi:hypothetical protein